MVSAHYECVGSIEPTDACRLLSHHHGRDLPRATTAHTSCRTHLAQRAPLCEVEPNEVCVRHRNYGRRICFRLARGRKQEHLSLRGEGPGERCRSGRGSVVAAGDCSPFKRSRLVSRLDGRDQLKPHRWPRDMSDQRPLRWVRLNKTTHANVRERLAAADDDRVSLRQHPCILVPHETPRGHLRLGKGTRRSQLPEVYEEEVLRLVTRVEYRVALLRWVAHGGESNAAGHPTRRVPTCGRNTAPSWHPSELHEGALGRQSVLPCCCAVGYCSAPRGCPSFGRRSSHSPAHQEDLSPQQETNLLEREEGEARQLGYRGD